MYLVFTPSSMPLTSRKKIKYFLVWQAQNQASGILHIIKYSVDINLIDVTK